MTTSGRVRVRTRVEHLDGLVRRALDDLAEKKEKLDLSFAAIEKRVAWLELPWWRRAWLRIRGRK